MTEGQFRVEMEAMAQTPGLGGCALVEVDSGMVLYAAGSDTNTHNIAEASVGFWRLSQRLDAYTAVSYTHLAGGLCGHHLCE